jgi:hypothetical protein
MWQQENDAILEFLRIEQEDLDAVLDRTLAQSLHADWTHDEEISGVGQRCKVPGCDIKHARHFCKVNQLQRANSWQIKLCFNDACRFRTAVIKTLITGHEIVRTIPLLHTLLSRRLLNLFRAALCQLLYH